MHDPNIQPCFSARTIISNSILLLLFLHLNKPTQAQDTVAFYFSAHEDDWQLFMNPNAYNDVQKDSTKVVFVYLTAGDAGAGLGNAGRAHPYYLARENGARLSVQFMTDANGHPVNALPSVASLSAHAISRWVYGNTVSYFLRLPDGNPNGTGYPFTGEQSLRRLRERAIPTLTAIDGSAAYQGWNDLTATLRALIDHERGSAASVWVNLADPDTSKNVGDHNDHQHVAMGVLEALAGLPCINKVFYLNGVTEKMPVNMTPAEREVEAGTFGALVAGVTALDHASPFDNLHRSWLSRNYFRIVPGRGNCPQFKVQGP